MNRMMRFGLLIFLVILAFSQASGQSICQCDKYEQVLRQFRSARDAGDLTEAERISSELIKDTSPFCHILGINLLSNAKLAESQMESTIALIQKQKRLLDSLACDQNQYLEYYLTKSSFHYAVDEYDSSIANSLKALKIAEETHNVSRQITLRLGIGSAFYRTGQPEKKMEYARSIIPLIDQIGDSSYSCQYYFNLFGAYYTYYKANRDKSYYLDSAALYNSKALIIARKTKNRRFLPYCFEALEIINHENNGSPIVGLKYLDSALYYGRTAMSNGQISELLLNKANLLKQIRRYQLAVAYADSALYFSSQNPQKSVYASHLEDASILFGDMGDYQKALSLHREADQILDSIKSITNAKVVRELEEKYHQEKNERKIEQLSKESEINQLQIKVLIFGVLLALIAIILIIFIYRLTLLKQRKSAIESKYRLNQALINPHFLSNALVSIQRFMVENNAAEASNYLTRFSRLMRQLLESAYLDVISLEEEVELIKNYLSIQKLRFKDSFDFEIHLSDSVLNEEILIAPMFVQPFVENAVEHGINGMDNGRIDIYFELMEDRLSIIIMDNGKGINESDLGQQKSLSTTILKERVELLNKTSKQKIYMNIDKGNDRRGVKVTLLLPIHP